jgi:hypothetical protein
LRARAFGRVDDLGSGLVQNPVIVRFQSYANAFSQHRFPTLDSIG